PRRAALEPGPPGPRALPDDRARGAPCRRPLRHLHPRRGVRAALAQSERAPPLPRLVAGGGGAVIDTLTLAPAAGQEQVAALIARHPGEDDVLLHLQAGGSEVTMQVGERFRVASGPALTADLEAPFQRWTGGAGAPTAIDRPDGARVQPGAQALDVEPIVVT